MWYYMHKAGISDTPWKCDNAFAIASGDDVVVWVEPKYAERLRRSIECYSVKVSKKEKRGIGQ